MKARTIVVALFIVASLLMAPGCAEKSFRETPAVKVIQGHASAVVNIRTENVIDLKEHPYWEDMANSSILF